MSPSTFYLIYKKLFNYFLAGRQRNVIRNQRSAGKFCPLINFFFICVDSFVDKTVHRNVNALWKRLLSKTSKTKLWVLWKMIFIFFPYVLRSIEFIKSFDRFATVFAWHFFSFFGMTSLQKLCVLWPSWSLMKGENEFCNCACKLWWLWKILYKRKCLNAIGFATASILILTEFSIPEKVWSTENSRQQVSWC